eukprot:11204987-Ditylum_brightwellii.AAC.1
MEKENVKTSPNRAMRDVMVWEKITRENKRTRRVRLCSSSHEACSAHALYHGAAEAPVGPVCQGRQKAGQKVWPNRQRGQGS